MSIKIFPILLYLSFNNVFTQSDVISTEVLIGNQVRQRAEVYRLTFFCNNSCSPEPIGLDNLLWASPNVSGISEVKRVIFKGENAVLVTVRNGAVVFAYETNTVLFGEEICGLGIGTHSAEVLPDASVAVVGTYEIFFLKYTPNECQLRNETTSFSIQFGHGVAYDRKRNKLYVLTYLSLEVFDLSDIRGIPRKEDPISLGKFYYSPDHNENVHIADGGHDLYPLAGYEDILFLTTGERVFVYNASNGTISYHQLYYYIPSLHGGNVEYNVRYKGGVKAISRDSKYQLNIIHAAPWYKVIFQSDQPSTNHQIKFSDTKVRLMTLNLKSQFK